MTNDTEIKKFIAAEINNGVGLSKIQDMIAEKFNVKYTFLEMRMLAAELEDVNWQKLDPATPDKPEEEAAPKPAAGDGVTHVTKSSLARPGALASGEVVFASGAKADWILDRAGRLGLDNVVGEPTEEDYKGFQEELRKLFESGI